MNGIICRITILCSLFVILGCKKESLNQEAKKDLLSIDDIKLIKLQDTLRLDYNGDDLGENTDFGNRETQYKSLLFSKMVMDSQVSKRFKQLEYNDEKSFEWIKIKKRIKLHSNYNTVILSTGESVYTLLNYNSTGELIDFLDLTKYNQQICQCESEVYIDKKGIVHCQIESGKPFYPFVNYKVNKDGKFEIIDSYTPLNEHKTGGAERLDYIIRKATLENEDLNLKSFLESDDFTPTNTTLIDEKDIKKVLFSKNNSDEVYNSFLNSIREYTKEDKSLTVLRKVLYKKSLLLICNLNRADQFGVVFILNDKHEVVDFRIFSIEGNYTSVQGLLENEQ